LPTADASETVDVIVNRPMARHNVYSYDQRRKRIRLEAVRDVEDRRSFEFAHIEEHDERLPVILLSLLPTFERCLIEARILGGIQHLPAIVVLATPVADPMAPQDIDSVECSRQELACAAVDLLGSPDGAVSFIGAAEALRYVDEWRRSVRAAAARRAQVRSGAAWKVAPSKDGGGPHTWAENLLFSLPLRFQNYVAELLFDDERILFYIDRPSFRHPGRFGSLRGKRANEGLFVLTDRMFLFMEDAIPPGITMVHWGYRAYIVAVEQILDAELVTSGPVVTLCLHHRAEGGQTDTLRIPFPESYREALEDVLPLLRAFAAEDTLLPRRVYTASPVWAHHELTKVHAPAKDRSQQAEDDTVVALSDRGRAVLSGGTVTIESDKDRSAAVPICEITSFSLLRALTGCRFTLRSGASGRVAEHSISFNYPQAPAFLELTARLRHLLGNPR
jgi:hypothetical protein